MFGFWNGTYIDGQMSDMYNWSSVGQHTMGNCSSDETGSWPFCTLGSFNSSMMMNFDPSMFSNGRRWEDFNSTMNNYTNMMMMLMDASIAALHNFTLFKTFEHFASHSSGYADDGQKFEEDIWRSCLDEVPSLKSECKLFVYMHCHAQNLTCWNGI